MPVQEREQSDYRRESRERRRLREQRMRRRRRKRILLLLLAILVIAGSVKLISATLHGGNEDAADTPVSGPVELPEEPEQPPIPQEPEEPELTDADKMDIISTSPEYNEDLLTFAEKYPQVLDYVYLYPEKKDIIHEIDLTQEAALQEPPLLIQWDERWGYVPYGKGLIGYSGCGPVALSMAALYLTGDPQYTPVSVAKMAEEKGYCVPGNGSAWTLISEGCQYVGLSARELPLSEGVMKKELDQDHPIIVIVGPGDFTFGGHYMLITGYDEEGFIINDSNSPENSAKRWSYEVIQPQIRNLWAMSAA